MLEPHRKHGPWQIVRRHYVYSDPWVRLHQDEVIRPDGQPGSFCVVHVKPGVCVLAIDDQQRVHLTDEFHYGVGRHTLEAVSGGIEAGEDPAGTARRELAEELGILAACLEHLGTVDPFTANVVSPTELFVARQLQFGDQQPDGTELIRHVSMPLAEAVDAVLQGRITHGPTCVLVLKAAWSSR